MVNVMFILLTKRAFPNIIEGVNSKPCLLAPLEWIHPPFFCITYTTYNIYNFSHILGKTNFYPQLRYFHVLFCCMNAVGTLLLVTSVSQAATVRTIC